MFFVQATYAVPGDVVFTQKFKSPKDIYISRLAESGDKEVLFKVKENNQMLAINPPITSLKTLSKSYIHCRWEDPKEERIYQIDEDSMVLVYSAPESELRVKIKIKLSDFLRAMGVKAIPEE